MRVACSGYDEYGPCGQVVLKPANGEPPYCVKHRPGGPPRRGRPKVYAEPRVGIHLQLPEALKTNLELMARHHGVTFTELVSSILEAGLEALSYVEPDQPPQSVTSKAETPPQPPSAPAPAQTAVPLLALAGG